MSPMLMFASLAITGALVLYTIGVFKERADGSLRGPHVVLFWIGLACDTTGTCLLYTSPSPRDRSLSRMPSSA